MRIILAVFTDRYEIYGSLKPFFEQYPEYAELRHKIEHVMSRKKLPFTHLDFKLLRLHIRKSHRSIPVTVAGRKTKAAWKRCNVPKG